jgi:hypothetical protein
MKKLTTQDFREIKTWIYRNARQVELALWQYYFENGSRDAEAGMQEAVVESRNSDSGRQESENPEAPKEPR